MTKAAPTTKLAVTTKSKRYTCDVIDVYMYVYAYSCVYMYMHM